VWKVTVAPDQLNDTHTQTVGLPWTRNRHVIENSNWQNTTITTDRYPCPRRDSNPQSQQAATERGTVKIYSIKTAYIGEGSGLVISE